MVDGGQLLVPLRVLDLSDGAADAIGRMLADLGADVLKVESPTGARARTALPTVGTTAIAFALHNANKRSVILDPAEPADRRRLLELAETADILIDSGIPGQAAAFGTSAEKLADDFGHLVAMSVTDFGAVGPHASWVGTDPVFYALSTALSRSGPTTGTPVLPPDGIASASAAAQAAWALLAAYYQKLRSGRGDYIDFSRYEGTLQSLDPPFGSMGQAAAGLPKGDAWRGRPRNQDIYPIFACADGFVRICILSPRQWHGVRAWLGDPEEFRDPKFDTIGARYSATKEIGAALSALFAPQSMSDLVAAGQGHGVPVAAVMTPAEVLAAEHFPATGALSDEVLGTDVDVDAPVGYFVIDGERAGFRSSAPQLGADEAAWLSSPARGGSDGPATARPFEGLRILDLGIIVAGGELGRLFADLGAEVIKVESAAYPDGLRQTRPGQLMSESFARTHRNEYGLGLDLRTPEGAAIFERLVAESDAVFANFKPGTLAALGFSYERLQSIKPGIVLAESSAFGDSGPWSARMGYGPLVRATTGITRLWTSDDPADTAFYDATTVFPDHIVARITALGALAALIHRDRGGPGAHIHISQAEAAVNQLDTLYVSEAAKAAGLEVSDDPSVHHVYPCAGDDEWCVISVRSDADRAALARVLGRDALPADRAGLVAVLSEWTQSRDKAEVTESLQAVGVPAAGMHRVRDVLDDPQVRRRAMFSEMAHPLFDEPMLSETGPAPYRNIPASELRPAPVPGEHTREICQKVLGLDTEETERLIAEGVLFSTAPPA